MRGCLMEAELEKSSRLPHWLDLLEGLGLTKCSWWDSVVWPHSCSDVELHSVDSESLLVMGDQNLVVLLRCPTAEKQFENAPGLCHRREFFFSTTQVQEATEGLVWNYSYVGAGGGVTRWRGKFTNI